jgi:phospholipid transport system substrate-binding protein
MFKQLVRGLILITTLVSANIALASDQNDPYQLVKDVASVTFDRIKREQSQIQKNPELLRTIMEEELLPYVDYKFSAAKVLGKHYKNVSRAELQEFVKVFREYLITTYALALGYYDDQLVEFAPSRTFDGKKTVTVRALVKENGRPDIKIAFKVRKNSRTNKWKAYDMVAEGISMLSSKHTEFQSILRKEGVQKVIELMQDKIDKPIVLESLEEVAKEG